MSPNSKGRAEGTRDRIIRLLRESPKTVDQLAGDLGVTLNAVRSQLTILERDGIVQVTGDRRGPRRPAHIYGLTPEGDRLLSRAYSPVLKAILKVMSLKGAGEAVEDILREAGRMLAAEYGRPSGDLASRVAKAAGLLEAIGGAIEVETAEDQLILRGKGCPLSDAVETEPRTCKCVEAFLSELTGAHVEEKCERGEQKRCAFVISPARSEVKRSPLRR